MSEASGRDITINETTVMDKPVDVDTRSVAAFVGRTLLGPLNRPVLVQSFSEFSQRFGGLWVHSCLGPSVEQFFDHGGSRAYIVRVANNASGAILTLPAANGVLALRAQEPGSIENIRVSVDYDRLLSSDSEHFNLTVQRTSPATSLVLDQEIYNGLSCSDTSRNFVADALLHSGLVRAETVDSTARPFATIGPHVGARSQYIGRDGPGTDGDELSDYDLVGSATEQTGIFSLNGIDQLDLLYLSPGGPETDLGPAAIMAAELYCRKRGAMLILDPPVAWASAQDAVTGVRLSGYSSANILTYFPRLAGQNDSSAQPSPVGGAIAGLLCKLDDHLGPWHDLNQPAFSFRRGLKSALVMQAADTALLVREGINVITDNAAGRMSLQGAVTTARRTQREQQLVCLTTRRLLLLITNTIGRATRWAVFAPDSNQVEHRLQAQVQAFMTSLADQGAFEGAKFSVQCVTKLPQLPTDSARGVTILIAFLPADSSEYVRVTLHQTVQDCAVRSTAFAPAITACA